MMIIIQLCLMALRHNKNGAHAFLVSSSSPSLKQKTLYRRTNVLSFVSSSANESEEEQDDGNNYDNDNDNERNDSNEASRLRAEAEKLRDEIRRMEDTLQDKRQMRMNDDKNNNGNDIGNDHDMNIPVEGKTLRNKRVLVVGANGRLGSMVVRHLLRNFPELDEVVAAVHYVGEATTRGYGRLSYEVGAEDGIGSIGPAWSGDSDTSSSTATFEFNPETMTSYNLNKLRVVEVELLDPVQCTTITENVDSVIWCATDFDKNKPRSIASLNIAFLFRAIADPTKGRVEIEGLTNILGGLKLSKQAQYTKSRYTAQTNPPSSNTSTNTLPTSNTSSSSSSSSNLCQPNDPTSFILVSTSPHILPSFETPFGEFNGLKRQGEQILIQDFPSLTHSILQMGLYDDNFVSESLELQYDANSIDNNNNNNNINNNNNNNDTMQSRDTTPTKPRKINRRDAARAAANALLDPSLENQISQVWTFPKEE